MMNLFNVNNGFMCRKARWHNELPEDERHNNFRSLSLHS
jgi:hypothetical protein